MKAKVDSGNGSLGTALATEMWEIGGRLPKSAKRPVINLLFNFF